MRPLVFAALAALSLSRCACPTPDPPPLRGVEVGTIIGEAFLDEGNGLESVDGAVVRVLGLGVEEVTVAGEKFVLEAIPLGTHEVSIEHDGLARAVSFEVTIESAFQTVALDPSMTTLGRAARVAGQVVVDDPIEAVVFLVGGDAGDVASPGDDGSFVIPAVPAGPAQIAFSRSGFDLKIVDVVLAEGDNLLEPVTLAPSTASDLTLAGSAQLVGSSDHRGVAVRLNDGAEVSSTEASGAFTFTGLAPGRYTLTASKPGFRTATLPTVALDSAGRVLGIVPIFLQPGEDPPPPVVAEPRVTIAAPVSGAALVSGATSAFDALVENADVATLTWTIALDGGAETAIGAGAPLVVTLPTVAARTQLDVAARLPDGTGDSVTVFVDPVVVVPAAVTIAAPLSGDAFLAGATSAFDAIVENADPATLTWTMALDRGTPTAVGAGTPVVVTLPTVTARSQLDVEARLPDGTADTVTVFVDPVVVPPPVVTITAPGPGDVLSGATAAVLDATVANATSAELSWSLRVFGQTAETPLGTGAPLVVTLPDVVARESFEIVARVPDSGAGAAEDSVVFFIDPAVIIGTDPFVPGADALVAGVVADPLVVDGAVVGSRFVIQEGQPITIEPAVGLAAVFSDGTQAFADALPLRGLPVGTHRFTATFTTDTGQQGTSIIDVEVQPLVFTIAIVDPVASATFFDDTPITLRAQIMHGFQTGFLADSVVWRDQNAAVIGNGALDSVTLPSGPSVVALEVIDVIGNVRTTVVPIDVVSLAFTARFNAPSTGASVLEGTPLRINVGFDHNRLTADERAAAFIQVISDRAGQLTDDAGVDTFTADTDHFISTLAEGTHVLTARVFAGGRIATTTTTVNIAIPFVSSVLLSATDTLAVPGQPLVFEVAASGGNGAVPLIQWFLDGVEFSADWAGYGTDFADPLRQQMDFGLYDPLAAPFTDPRWFEGPHLVEAWVRTADVDASLGCIDQGARAQCHAINLNVAAAPRIITSNLTLTNPATPEVWSGVVQLQAEVLINGGKLVILPGTQVLVDMRNVASPTTAVTAGEREIVLQAGSLEIGAENGAEVVFETIKNFPATPKWNGIHQGAINANERLLIAHNTTLRDTALGLTLDRVDLVNGSRLLVLDGFAVENSTQGIRIECATTLQNIRLKNIGAGGAAALQLRHSAFCPGSERIDGLSIEGAQNGLQLFPAASPTVTTVTGADIQGAVTRGLVAQGNVHLVLENSRLSGNTNGSGTVGALHLDAGGSGEVYDSVFDNNVNAVAVDDPGTLGFTATNTRFLNPTRAIHVNGINEGIPIEVHASTFENATLILEWQNTGTNFVGEARLEGNFVGEATQVGTAAELLADTPAGVFPNAAQIIDARDTLGSQVLGTTRIDNPLPTTAIPHAVIIEPHHMHAYNGLTQCIPAIAHARQRTFNAATGCNWRIGPPGGAAADATVIRPDIHGCLPDVADGEHALHLVCDDGVSETVHSTRLLVDSTRYAGVIHPAGETWSGTVVVDGDVVIPVGSTLTIAPGTTVRVKDTDRTFHWRPFNVGATAQSLKLRGSPARVDFHAFGNIDVLGEPGAPVRIVADSLPAPARWGGIIAGGNVPTIRIHHTTVTGADSVMASSVGFAPANSPVYDVVELDVEDSSFVFTGLCPSLIANLDVLRNVAVADCGASGEILFDGGNWLETRGGGATSMVHLLTQTGGTLIEPTIQNVVATGVSTGRKIFFNPESSAAPDSSLINVDVQEVSTLVNHTGGNQRTFIDGSRLRFFGNAVTSNSGSSDVIITNSAFEDGTRILSANIQVFTMDGSRATRVTKVIETLPRSYQTIAVTNSRIEGATTVFDFNQTANGVGPATALLSGNNFLGTTNRVLLLRGAAFASLTTAFDMRNNHFDTADRATILTLVEDPRSDVDANDDIEGRTDFSLFSATPLPLSTP